MIRAAILMVIACVLAGAAAPKATQTAVSPKNAPIMRTVVQPVADPGCAQGHDDRRSELCAQWKAADAAAEAAHSAERQTVTGWIGLAFGGATMLAAIAAAIFAHRAAVATEATVQVARGTAADATTALKIAELNAAAAAEQVAISQDSARRRLRAYICVLPLEMEPITSSSSLMQLTLPFQNTGPTPVKKWHYIWSWIVTDQFPTEALFDSEMTKYHPENEAFQYSFGPEQTKPIHLELDMDAPHRDAVLSGKKKLYVMGYVTYVDSYDDEHKTEFFYVYNTTGRTRFGQASLRNAMT